jgi:ABC-type sugar transport system, permease component
MKSKRLHYATLAFLVVVALLVLIPFYWMLNTALKTELEALRTPPSLFPSSLEIENVVRVLELAPFMRYFTNTLSVSVIIVILSTSISILSAYAFAQLDFTGKNLLFFFVLATMMVPQEMLIITNFMTVADLGWLNTIRAIALPLSVNAFNIYLLRQTMLQIPNELYIAARIDGLTNLKYLFKVVIPQSKPTIFTVIILTLIRIWNTYAWPNLITTRDSLRMVSNGLRHAFSTNSGSNRLELEMMASTLVTIPLIIVFLCLRRYVLSGIERGGVKG